MNCPNCQSDRITKADLNRSGTQRYQCMDCKKRFTPRAKKAGRKLAGDKPMTGAERVKRSRLKRKQQEQEKDGL